MTEIRAEVTGSVWQVKVEVGQQVAEGDELVVLESMKMEIAHVAEAPCTVREVRVAPADQVTEGDVLLVVDPD